MNSLRFSMGGARVEVDLNSGVAQPAPEVLHWIYLAGDAVTTFYGKFPVPHLRISVGAGRGNPVHGGTTYNGRHIVVRLNPSATAQDLNSDWIMTHEMFHLGFPNLDDEYHYLEEGLSDYLEPLARARVGNLTEAEVWKGFIEGMPRGLPRGSDGGLDGTRDWGRVYWGGCIFWLLVDLDIRERSGIQMSLDDSIRAIVAAGGTGDHDWSLETMIAVGDAATRTGSIRRIHSEFGPKAVDPNLPEIWRKLGIRLGDGSVSFDDSARLAGIRRSMTAPRAHAGPDAIARPL